MATVDDRLLSVLESLDDFLKRGGSKNNTSSHSYYSPFNRDMEDDEKRRERELRHQDLLDARLRGRYDIALEMEHKIFEESQKLYQEKADELQKNYEQELDNINKLKKEYRGKSIEELEEKKKRARSDKKKDEIQAVINQLKEIEEIQEQISLRQVLS